MVKTSPAIFGFSILDFSFRSFVTPKLIQIIYVLAIVGAAVLALITFVACTSLSSILASMRGGYGRGGPDGAGVLLGLVVSPIEFVVLVVGARVVLETAIALFRIAENVDVLARK